MFAGGLGLCETTHVRLIVDPVSMNISGMPIIVVIGSAFVDMIFKQNVKGEKIFIKLMMLEVSQSNFN